MQTLKRILVGLAVTFSLTAHASGLLTAEQFEKDLKQVAKDVASKSTRAEALAVVEKYTFALMDQAKDLRNKNDALYHRANGMIPRMAIILQESCDDVEVSLEFGDGDMSTAEDTAPSPDLKKVIELSKAICAK